MLNVIHEKFHGKFHEKFYEKFHEKFHGRRFLRKPVTTITCIPRSLVLSFFRCDFLEYS